MPHYGVAIIPIAVNRGWYIFSIFFNCLQKVARGVVLSQSDNAPDSRVKRINYIFFLKGLFFRAAKKKGLNPKGFFTEGRGHPAIPPYRNCQIR